MYLHSAKNLTFTVTSRVYSMEYIKSAILVKCIRSHAITNMVNKSCFSMGKFRSLSMLTNSQSRLSSVTHISKAGSHNNIEKPDTIQTDKLEEVQKLMKDLNSDERKELFADLQIHEAGEIRKRAEEKLASLRWRSRFGRPSSIYPSNVDPTGTYCEIPADWLQKKAAELTKPRPPNWTELRKLAVFNALPFVGFGFLDNCIMIFCGDKIDATIGIYLGISTMAAAALGNTISDLAGIGSAWYVETLVTKCGMHAPPLSPEQLELSSSRIASNFGRSVGIVIGCLIGMFPLLFLSDHKKDVKVTEKLTDENSE